MVVFFKQLQVLDDNFGSSRYTLCFVTVVMAEQIQNADDFLTGRHSKNE